MIKKEILKYRFYYIGSSLLLLLLSYMIGSFLLITLLLFLSFFFIYIFKDEELELQHLNKDSVVSPATGKIIAIDKLVNNGEYAYAIKIDSTYLDNSILRTPMICDIDNNFLRRGSRLSPSSELFEYLNESLEITFKNENNNKVLVKHILKRGFLPIYIDTSLKKDILQSTRYGISLNSITTLYIPKNFKLNLYVGARVSAGKSIVGYFE